MSEKTNNTLASKKVTEEQAKDIAGGRNESLLNPKYLIETLNRNILSLDQPIEKESAGGLNADFLTQKSDHNFILLNTNDAKIKNTTTSGNTYTC